MKRVVTSSMVAHLWANQSQDTARNGKDTVSFRGFDFYSYSTRIGVLTDARLHGKQVVLFLDYRSHTTQRHLRYAQHALDSERQCSFTVSRLAGIGEDWNAPDTHARNVRVLYAEYETRVAALVKPRIALWGETNTLANRERAIYSAATTYREYCMAFSVAEPNPNFEGHIATLREAWARYYDPKQANARDARNAQGRLIEARAIGRLYAIAEGVLPLGELQRVSLKWDNRRSRVVPYDLRDRLRSIIRAQRTPNAVTVTADEWRAGKRGTRPWYGNVWPAYPMLRRRGEILETSQGATVSWATARTLFQVATRSRVAATAYRPIEQVPFRIGVFTLNWVDADGNARVGCHDLRYEEMERLALREAPELVRPRYPVPAVRDTRAHTLGVAAVASALCG